jgi:hypothetical protein
MKLKDGSVKSIYCHFDGYLQHNGKMLYDHYNTKEKVEDLLNLGSLSILAEKVHPDPNFEHRFDGQRQDDVCLAYGRDRGETGQEAIITDEKDFVDAQGWEEYFYLFDPETNKWSCSEYGQDFDDLEEELDRLTRLETY